MFCRCCGRATAVLFTLGLFCACAQATILAELRGVVHDPAHRPIANADVLVQAVNSGYRMALHSDAAGVFETGTLPAGDYRVRVEAVGFAAEEQQIGMISGSARVLHFELAVAGSREVVHVTDTVAEADASSATIQTTITRKQIETYAGAGQSNSLRLITQFVPGSYVVHDQLHVRGGHQVTWALDGVPLPNTNIATNVGPQFDPKDIDSIEAQTGGYSADYGDRT